MTKLPSPGKETMSLISLSLERRFHLLTPTSFPGSFISALSADELHLIVVFSTYSFFKMLVILKIRMCFLNENHANLAHFLLAMHVHLFVYLAPCY